MAAKVRLLLKPTCTSCRKARGLLQAQGVEIELRDLEKQRLSVAELDALIGDRDYTLFLNPKNELYRARNMKQKPPSRPEALKLMAENPNLIRRPVTIRGRQMVLGYDEAALKKLVK